MSSNHPFFSIIVYIDNESANLTLKSITESSPFKEGRVQVILAKSSSYECTDLGDVQYALMLDKKYDTRSKAYKAAVKKVNGEYTAFMQCGAVYSPTALEFAKAYLTENGSRFAALMCNAAKDNVGAQEIDRCFKGKPSVCDLNEKYTVPFIFLSNCFFLTSALCDPDDRIDNDQVSEGDIMLHQAMDSQYLTIMRDPAASVTPYFAAAPAFSFYEDFRHNEAQLRQFFDIFVIGHLDECKKKYGYVPLFVQFNIMMYLRWTLTAPGAEGIFAACYSVEEYKKALAGWMQDIDDNVIGNCGLLLAHKNMIFRLKYNDESRTITVNNGKRMYYHNTRLCDMAENPTSIEFVELSKDKAVIYGRVKYVGCDESEFSVFALVNGETKIKAEDIGHYFGTDIWGENIYPGISFRFEVDLSKLSSCSIELFSVNNGDTVKRKGLRFGKFSPLCSTVPDCYYYNDGRIMTYDKTNSAICIRRASKFDKFKCELRYLNTLSKKKDDYAKHAYLARMVCAFIKPFMHKEIWLISDRVNRGDDNGEALFKYLQTVKNKKIKPYFVIDKNCEEGKRMAKIGKTISTNSKKHKIYHLLSSYVISSQGNNPVVNPLLGGNIYYRDMLCKMRFVFLQHGVTKDDISVWLNLYNRNMYGFIVTTNQEYQSVFDYNYFYTPDRVWLTGMPRNDLLYHDEKKYITIMPTWRKSLMTKPDPVTGIWILRDDFKDSEYFRFYNSLLNDERLISAAKKYGYTICYKPHPNIEPYLDRFDKHPDVLFFETDKTYREIFAETDLMLTDYSSVAFDFAYLRKPIVYAHFDKEAFFSGEHSYTAGYFDYERDGFGECEYDLESTINTLIGYMENDCKPKEKYLERINNTFAFSDKNCCERVYNKLIANS